MRPRVQYEHRAVVDDATTDEGGGLDLRAWEYRGARCLTTPWSSARFTVADTPEALALEAGADVKFYRRRRGDEEWGAPWFVGYLESPHPLRDKPHLRLACRGHLALLRRSEVRNKSLSGTSGLAVMLEDWAYEYASDWFDDIDIEVTEPLALPTVMELSRGSPLEFLSGIRRFAAVHMRIREEANETRTLEVRDEIRPTDAVWDALDEEGHALRTFGPKARHQEKAPRLTTPELYSRMDGGWRGVAVIGPGGGALATVGVDPDLFVDTEGLQGDAQAYAESAWEDVREPRRCGWIQLTGIAQDAQNAPYSVPNDILRITENRRGTEGLYAVQRVWWAQTREATRAGKWLPSTVTLVLADRVFNTYIPLAMPGGPDATARRATPHAQALSDEMKDILHPPESGNLTL